MNTSQQVWKVYSFTTWGSNGHSVLKEMLYDSLKKVHRRELPKALTTILGFVFLHPIMPFFSNYASCNSLYCISTKS